LEKTATLMATFYGQKGGEELSRRLLLLGSGYLGESLGHSVSSASFILLEMMERRDQDPWPALVTLSDFFCKARFHTTPSFQNRLESPWDVTPEKQMLRATSGQGIINMHNTITHYAIERTRRFFTEEEYNYMKGAWAAFMGSPEEKSLALDSPGIDLANDYNRLYEIFSRHEAKSVVASLEGMIFSKQGRRQLGRFLIRALCDQYQGRYDPHYLTGLGAALWTVERYWNQAPIALNAIFQYLNFYFENIISRK